MKPDHLYLVTPPAEVTIIEPPKPPPWWLAPELVALAELRRTMAGSADPAAAAVTAEQSARHAVFWVLFEVEHLIRELATRVEAGESLRIRHGIYKFQHQRVDFDLRIVEHEEITSDLPSPGGAS